MPSIQIAFRNVSRQRKRSLLLAGAIAFGFFVFTIINGFTGGLLKTVEGNIASSLGGHIYISGTEVSEQGREIPLIRDTETLQITLPVIEDEIRSYGTRSSANTSLIFGSKEEVQMLVGVDFSQETGFLDTLTFVEGTPEAFLKNERALLLPADLVGDLGVEVGESLIVKASTINGQQNVGDFTIAGSIENQGGLPFTFGYTHLASLNSLLDMDADQYQTLNIYLNDLSELEPATTALFDELARLGEVEPRDTGGGGPDFARVFGLGQRNTVDKDERWEGTKFEVTNVNDNTSEVSTLVEVMEAIGLAIFLIIISIIMVGIMNSYRMVMIERTAEVGTMRAMGVQKAAIRNIFIWEALLIALGGALVGLVAAFLFMGGMGLLSFDTTAFSFFLDQGRVRFAVAVFETLGNVVLLCLMSIAAVYIPARAAANLRPAEALRAS